MKAEDLEAEVKATIDDIDQWGYVQGEVDVYMFDEEDLQQYKRAIIESQFQALKKSGKEFFSEHAMMGKDDFLNLITNLEDK